MHRKGTIAGVALRHIKHNEGKQYQKLIACSGNATVAKINGRFFLI